MQLIYDEIDDGWVWVNESNHDEQLSPLFDEKEYTENWLDRIKKELS